MSKSSRSRISWIYAGLLVLAIVVLFWQEPRHEWTKLEPEAVPAASGQQPAAHPAVLAAAQP